MTLCRVANNVIHHGQKIGAFFILLIQTMILLYPHRPCWVARSTATEQSRLGRRAPIWRSCSFSLRSQRWTRTASLLERLFVCWRNAISSALANRVNTNNTMLYLNQQYSLFWLVNTFNVCGAINFLSWMHWVRLWWLPHQAHCPQCVA